MQCRHTNAAFRLHNRHDTPLFWTGYSHLIKQSLIIQRWSSPISYKTSNYDDERVKCRFVIASLTLICNCRQFFGNVYMPTKIEWLHYIITGEGDSLTFLNARHIDQLLCATSSQPSGAFTYMRRRSLTTVMVLWGWRISPPQNTPDMNAAYPCGVFKVVLVRCSFFEWLSRQLHVWYMWWDREGYRSYLCVCVRVCV